MTVKSLLVRISADTSDFHKALHDSQSKFHQVGESMQKVGKGLTAAVTLPLLGIGAASVKMAMDAVESENLFEVSMGGMAEQARAWSEDLREQLGLNAYEVRKNVGMFFNMFESMALGSDKAYDLSTGLTQLSYDMASFYNLKPEEAFDKLRAGITGEIEPLKRLGILVDENTTKTYAYASGIAKQGEELTQQQKVMARYGLILEQTKNAQGDLARTLDSPTNKLRVIGERAKQTAIDFGMALLPAFTSLLDGAKPLLDLLGRAVQWFSSLPTPVKNVVIAVGGLAVAAGPVLFIVGKLITMAPALSVGLKMLGHSFTGLLGPIGLVVAAGTAAYVVFQQVKDAQKAAAEAAAREAEVTGKFKEKLWQAAEAAGYTRDQFEQLTQKYNGNVAALGMAIHRGKEGVEIQKSLAAVGKEHKEEIDKQIKALEDQANAQWRAQAAAQAAQKQAEEIIGVRRQLTDEIAKATMTERDYQKWAVESAYEERRAAISKEITDEKAKGELLLQAAQSRDAQLAALAKQSRDQELQARIDFAKQVYDEEAAQTVARLEAQRAYLAQRQSLTDAVNQLTMGELEYSRWAMEQERLAEEAQILSSKELTEQQKEDLLKILSTYYDEKKKKAEEDASGWTELVENTKAAITTTLGNLFSDTLDAFQNWGDAGGSILKNLSDAFKGMVGNALAALRDLVTGTLMASMKEILAAKAVAIAHAIKSVMASVPFPLNLALVGGAIAAVSRLFSAIKLGEGGLVTRPTLALVGERGPEAVIPLDRPGALGFAGGGMTLRQSIYFYGDINNAGDLDEISRRLAERTVQAISKGRR